MENFFYTSIFIKWKMSYFLQFYGYFSLNLSFFFLLYSTNLLIVGWVNDLQIILISFHVLLEILYLLFIGEIYHILSMFFLFLIFLLFKKLLEYWHNTLFQFKHLLLKVLN